MNAKKRNVAISALLLADLAATEAWAAPSIISKETLCRGGLYRLPEKFGVLLKKPDPAQGAICLAPAANPQSRAQCGGEDLWQAEGGGRGSDADRRDAGTVPARFFHFIRESQQ